MVGPSTTVASMGQSGTLRVVFLVANWRWFESMNWCWQHQPLAVVAAAPAVHQPLAVVVAALGELHQVLAAVRAVVLAAVHQPLALRAAMLAAVESCLHQALAWRRRKQLQHQPLAVSQPLAASHPWPLIQSLASPSLRGTQSIQRRMLQLSANPQSGGI